MEVKTEFSEIFEARKSAYSLNKTITTLLILGFVSSIFSRTLAGVFSFFAFLAFYYRLYNIAKMPCPKCGEAFGTNSNIVFGVGTSSCQHCEASLYE